MNLISHLDFNKASCATSLTVPFDAPIIVRARVIMPRKVELLRVITQDEQYDPKSGRTGSTQYLYRISWVTYLAMCRTKRTKCFLLKHLRKT